MVIREAEVRDVPYLLDIYNYEVENGVATFDLYTKTIEERMNWFHQHNIDNHLLMVAEVDGHAVGYASLSPYREKEAYAATVELSIYISCRYRRSGIAKALMGYILKAARERDDIHSVISVITSGNQASIRIHEIFGFVYCGTLSEVGTKFGKMLDIDHYQLIL